MEIGIIDDINKNIGVIHPSTFSSDLEVHLGFKHVVSSCFCNGDMCLKTPPMITAFLLCSSYDHTCTA